MNAECRMAGSGCFLVWRVFIGGIFSALAGKVETKCGRSLCRGGGFCCNRSSMHAAHSSHGPGTALLETVVAGKQRIESWLARWSGRQARLTALQGVPSPRPSPRGVPWAKTCLRRGEGEGLRWSRAHLSKLRFRLNRYFDEFGGSDSGWNPSASAIISVYIAVQSLAAAGVATKTAAFGPAFAAFSPVSAGFGVAVAWSLFLIAGRPSAAAFSASAAAAGKDKSAAEAGKATVF
jgi:hypothetical protein